MLHGGDQAKKQPRWWFFFLHILPSSVYQMSIWKSEFYQQHSRLLNVFLIIRVTLCKEKFKPPSEKSLVALGVNICSIHCCKKSLTNEKKDSFQNGIHFVGVYCEHEAHTQRETNLHLNRVGENLVFTIGWFFFSLQPYYRI